MPALKRKQNSINLLPTDEGDQTLVARIIRWVLGTFRFLVIAVELVVIVGFLSRFYLDSRNSDLTDEINQKKALLESYLPFEKDFKRVQKKLDVFNTFAYSQTPFADYVSQVTRNLTTDLQLSKVTLNAGEITIVVIGKSEQSILSFASRLSKEELLSSVSVTAVEGVENSSAIQATIKTFKPITE